MCAHTQLYLMQKSLIIWIRLMAWAMHVFVFKLDSIVIGSRLDQKKIKFFFVIWDFIKGTESKWTKPNTVKRRPKQNTQLYSTTTDRRPIEETRRGSKHLSPPRVRLPCSQWTRVKTRSNHFRRQKRSGKTDHRRQRRQIGGTDVQPETSFTETQLVR